MNTPTFPKKSLAGEFPDSAQAAFTLPLVKSLNIPARNRPPQQRGVVLFLTLVALLAMSLAAVALIRSVDTSAMIVGNLASQRAATSSANAGIENAILTLDAIQAPYLAAHPGGDMYDAAHPLNFTNLAVNHGYFSSYDPATDNITDNINWVGNNCQLLGTDASGNKVEYVIQRMCRNKDLPIDQADCLKASVGAGNNAMNIVDATQTCVGCGGSRQPVQIRITVRSTGVNKTVSFVQSFTY